MRADLLALDLPMSPAAPGLARRALDALELDAAARDIVRLLASELVTNALVHSGTAATGLIRVSAQCAGDTLRLSVTDGGTRAAAVLPRKRPGRDGGFGLRLVAELALRWGVERGSPTTVWCEVGLLRAPGGFAPVGGCAPASH